MKKYTPLLLVLVLPACFIYSCKKSNTDTTKDYTAAIKDKTWCGALNYSNDSTQYYSVHFNTDNTLLWSQLTGDYSGHWAINKNKLTMTFDANTVQINADLTEENKMTNITDNTSYYEIKSGALLANPGIALDNTVWNGYQYPIFGNTLTPLKLSFLPLNAVIIVKGGTSYGPYSYTRSISGAVIRTKAIIVNPLFPNPFFCVITSDTEMKGSDAGSPWRWNTIKQ